MSHLQRKSWQVYKIMRLVFLYCKIHLREALSASLISWINTACLIAILLIE